MDTALPFGLRLAPMIFSALADGLEFMIRQAGVDRVGHYLDDFVLVGPPGSRDCSRFLQVALRVYAGIQDSQWRRRKQSGQQH